MVKDLFTQPGTSRSRRWGRTTPESDSVEVWLHSDRQFGPCPKREIMPDEWDIRVMAQEAAALAGCDYRELLRELLDTLTITRGRTRPDLTEIAHGDPGSGPNPGS
jgi:hypothetical protein